jgi:hypothetical protein
MKIYLMLAVLLSFSANAQVLVPRIEKHPIRGTVGKQYSESKANLSVVNLIENQFQVTCKNDPESVSIGLPSNVKTSKGSLSSSMKCQGSQNLELITRSQYDATGVDDHGEGIVTYKLSGFEVKF